LPVGEIDEQKIKIGEMQATLNLKEDLPLEVVTLLRGIIKKE